MKVKAKDIKEGMTIKRNEHDVRWNDLSGYMKVDHISYNPKNHTKRGEDKIFNDCFFFMENGTAETFVCKSDTLIEVIG